MPDPLDDTPATVDSAGDARTANNAVRHRYRVLTDAEKARMVAIKDAGAALIAQIDALVPTRRTEIARTRAEEAVMWAVKELTS